MESVGAVAERGPRAGDGASPTCARAVRRARSSAAPVVLMLPLDVQAAEARRRAAAARAGAAGRARRRRRVGRARSPDAARRGASGRRCIAGRGAVLAGAGPALRRARRARPARCSRRRRSPTGCSPATRSTLGIAGGFASPLPRELLAESDVVVALRRGAQPVDDPPRRARSRPARASSRSTSTPTRSAPPAGRRRRRRRRARDRRGAARGARRARAARAGARRRARGGDRRAALARRALRGAAARRHRPAHAQRSRSTTCCPTSAPSSSTPGTSWAGRRCTCACRTPPGFVFPQAFQCVGLGLGNAIGAALARPDRLTVAALGDGGALMALPELETLGRLAAAPARRDLRRRGLRRRGPPLPAAGRARSTSRSSRRPTSPRSPRPPAAAASPCARVEDLDGVRDWLAGRDRPLVRRRQGRPRPLRGMARGGLPRPLRPEEPMPDPLADARSPPWPPAPSASSTSRSR